jgi:4-methylaminobutanoate oxidase (formaldehyde-forming)
VYLALREAGEGLGPGGGGARHGGLVDAGYYAIDALRIEAGRRAWGAELGPDETPLEAGLMFAVKMDKAAPFIGREALRAAQGRPLRKKLVTVVLDDPRAYAWGGEALSFGAKPVGELSSAGWSLRAGRCVGLACVRGEAAARPFDGDAARVDLWGEPIPARVYDRWPG